MGCFNRKTLIVLTTLVWIWIVADVLANLFECVVVDCHHWNGKVISEDIGPKCSPGRPVQMLFAKFKTFDAIWWCQQRLLARMIRIDFFLAQQFADGASRNLDFFERRWFSWRTCLGLVCSADTRHFCLGQKIFRCARTRFVSHRSLKFFSVVRTEHSLIPSWRPISRLDKLAFDHANDLPFCFKRNTFQTLFFFAIFVRL